MLPRVQQVHALAQHPLMNMVYKGITGIVGTVQANMIALTTLHAHANTSTQNRNGHSVKSRFTHVMAFDKHLLIICFIEIRVVEFLSVLISYLFILINIAF